IWGAPVISNATRLLLFAQPPEVLRHRLAIVFRNRLLGVGPDLRSLLLLQLSPDHQFQLLRLMEKLLLFACEQRGVAGETGGWQAPHLFAEFLDFTRQIGIAPKATLDFRKLGIAFAEGPRRINLAGKRRHPVAAIRGVAPAAPFAAPAMS